jgi:hypothetical protein
VLTKHKIEKEGSQYVRLPKAGPASRDADLFGSRVNKVRQKKLAEADEETNRKE